MLNRRRFLATAAAAASMPRLSAQSEWGGPVLDIHVHPRRGTESAAAHLDGSGVAKAVLLARVEDREKVAGEIANHPGRFVWFAATDPSKPGGLDLLRKAIEGGGAIGFGEMKTHLAADSKDMRRLYDLAAEMNVPVLLHFQEVTHFEGEGTFNAGFHDFDKMLKAHRKTTFIAHADLFWANVSADVPANVAYPDGPIKPGGLSDKWLSDFPNFYGDMSANSGNNALSRDPDFMRAFLVRHQNKLMFGSDCSCRDGHGTGGSPILPRLKGKCVARDTLGLAKNLAAPEVLRKITWENGLRLLKIPS
jgi:predicted TIM-barrel fold metal-dependent hydrolase